MEATALRILGARSAERPKKRAILKILNKLPEDVRVLVIDETTLRLLPPLRAAWAQIGQQACVPISGRNAQATLFCALDLRIGRRVTMVRAHQRQADFQALLRRLRTGRGAQRPLVLLLGHHPSHIARATLRLAHELQITLLWLPKQCPSLNPVENLWRELKARISANRQFSTIEETTRYAEAWIQKLSPGAALRISGLHAKTFRLHKLCKNFWHPT